MIKALLKYAACWFLSVAIAALFWAEDTKVILSIFLATSFILGGAASIREVLKR